MDQLETLFPSCVDKTKCSKRRQKSPNESLLLLLLEIQQCDKTLNCGPVSSCPGPTSGVHSEAAADSLTERNVNRNLGGPEGVPAGGAGGGRWRSLRKLQVLKECGSIRKLEPEGWSGISWSDSSWNKLESVPVIQHLLPTWLLVKDTGKCFELNWCLKS